MTRTPFAQRGRSALLAGVAAAAALTGVAAPDRAYAWKPKTHVYIAEEAVRDALDGKVTLYETDYRTGKIVGVLGEFAVDPQMLAALKAAPQQYRAGVLGPDAYPDILTGQQVIHPEEAHAIDGHADGSNAWLSYVWNRGFTQSGSPQVRAFTLGYLTHAAGDIFAHTYVNHFAGGEFMLTPDPTNALKHLILEGYIGKRTPVTQSAFATSVTTGGVLNPRKREDLGLDAEPAPTRTTARVYANISQNDVSISGVEDFIYNHLTYAQPGSVLEASLLKGPGTSRSVPFTFSTLRNGLARDVSAYDAKLKTLKEPARTAYAIANGPVAEYKRAWIPDIDRGLKAWPALSHEVAKAIVYNEGGADLKAAEAAVSRYALDYLASMAGTPDALVGGAQLIRDVKEAILPKAMRDAIEEVAKQPLNLLKGGLQIDPEKFMEHLKNPDTHFNSVMNRRGGAHGGEVDHPIDLATFNRDHLKISDEGYKNSSLKWKIDDLPPAFNTLQLNKMLFLGQAGMKELEGKLREKGAALGRVPDGFSNVMLGWVQSLDAGNQWQGAQGSRPGAAPQPLFAQNNGQAYRILFLKQVGEKEWINESTRPAPSAPVGRTPVVQDLSPFAGEWVLTDRTGASIGKMNLALVDGVLSGRGVQADGRQGERFEFRSGYAVGAVDGTWAISGHGGTVTLQMGPDGRSFSAQSTNGSITTPWTGKRAAAVPPAAPPPPPSQTPAPVVVAQPSPPAPASGQPAPAPRPAPEPAYAGPPLSQPGVFHPLEEFDVRLDQAVAGRDGKVHLYVTVKNRSGKEKYVVPSAAALAVQLTDADGVSVRQGHAYRATGDAPENFPANVTLANGGELKLRYVIDAPVVHAPLRTASLRESDKKALVFDVAHADPNPSRAGAPPAGRGAFKSLSKFDVRIDNIATARDNKLEAFVTLRNPGREWLYVSSGSIKLRGADPDGGIGTTVSLVFSTRGERGGYDSLPNFYVEPGQEARVRFIWDTAVSGPIKVTDGTVEQVFTAGG